MIFKTKERCCFWCCLSSPKECHCLKFFPSRRSAYKSPSDLPNDQNSLPSDCPFNSNIPVTNVCNGSF